MNKNKFMQTDSKWGNLGYPEAPCYIRNCGCGEVSIANIIIEMEKYKKTTPRTIQPYCKQFAAPNCDGTFFSGIPKMMEHYGLTNVKEHQKMSDLWKELDKGNRVVIYLMGARLGGSRGVHWTSGGHFVCSVDYRKRDGKHEVYVKDSYSNSRLRNKWISYEDNMKNNVVRVWSGKLPPKEWTIQDKICAFAKLVADDKHFHYVFYKNSHTCPICDGRIVFKRKWNKDKGRYEIIQEKVVGKNIGWNCIGFAFACWHHVGIPCKCKCDVFTDQIYDAMLRMSYKDAKKKAAQRLGLDEDEFILKRKKGKPLDLSKLKKGDIVVYYTSSGYKHTALWLGDGKIADCTSTRKNTIKYGVKSYKGMTIKLAFRYKGK